jgi:uncharacterized protein involved in cysteine biosynthesis
MLFCINYCDFGVYKHQIELNEMIVIILLLQNEESRTQYSGCHSVVVIRFSFLPMVLPYIGPTVIEVCNVVLCPSACH